MKEKMPKKKGAPYFIIVIAFLILLIFSISFTLSPYFAHITRQAPHPGIYISQDESNQILINEILYYVDNSGYCSDSISKSLNSQTKPWCTIQHTADVMTAGETAIVMSGTYNENVHTINDGSPGRFIKFKANGNVQMKGFVIRNNYVKINGFDITGSGVSGGYIYVPDGLYVDNCFILNNNIHDGAPEVRGIYLRNDIDNNKITNCVIKGNTINNVDAAAIEIHGSNHLIEDNWIGNLIHDGIRFFGTNHIIRGNYFTNIHYDINAGDHTDIFQTVGDNRDNTYSILFEKNFVEDCDDTAVLMSSQDKSYLTVGDFNFRNNVFVRVSMQSTNAVPNIGWYHNTFYDCSFTNTLDPLLFKNEHGGSGDYGVVKNNLFIGCSGDNENEGWYSQDSGVIGLIADYNYVTKTKASDYGPKAGFPSYPTETHGINGGNPIFQNDENPLGSDGKPFTSDDGLIPLSNSPACSSGEDESDMGAYECKLFGFL